MCLDQPNPRTSSVIFTNCTLKLSQLFLQDRIQRLFSINTGRCLESTGDVGSEVFMSSCHPTSTLQRWDYNGKDESYHLRWNNSLCLDLTPSLSVIVQLWSNTLSITQQWFRQDCNLTSPMARCDCPWDYAECRGQLFLKNRGGLLDNYCLAYSGQSLQSALCTNSPLQQIVYDSKFRLMVVGHRWCLETNGRLGSPVALLPCSDSVMQKWQLDTVERYRWLGTGACLEFENNTIGAGLILKQCSSISLQRWYRSYCGIGFEVNETLGCQLCKTGYYKPSLGNTKCLECPSGSFTTPGRDRCIQSDISYGMFTIAGSRRSGFRDGQSTEALFSMPIHAAVDADDNMYIADFGNHAIRKINTTGYVSTVAGNGKAGFSDGIGANASFYQPISILKGPNGTILIADHVNAKIRSLNSAGVVETFLGFGSPGLRNGHKTTAMMNRPGGLYYNETSGYLIFSDRGNNRIRLLNCYNDLVSSVAGRGPIGSINGLSEMSTFNFPYFLTMAEEDLYVTDRSNHQIRKVNRTGFVSTFVGNGTMGVADGLGTAARLTFPDGIVYHQFTQSLFLSESTTNTIRRITMDGNVQTVPLFGLNQPRGLSLDNYGNILISATHTIFKIIPCPFNSRWNYENSTCECYPGFGYKIDDNTCQMCPLGTSKFNYGNFECTKCELGHESHIDRSHCIECPAGKQRLSYIEGLCTDCPIGEFKNSSGPFSCEKCPLGFISSSSGSKSCYPCPPHTESNANRSYCKACPPGKSRPFIVDIADECLNCPDDFYKPDQGDSDCVKCPPGSYSNGAYTGCVECPKGHYLTTNRTCEHCGLGKEPSVDRTECTVCPAGSFKPISQLISCIPCPLDAECDSVWFKCKIGYYEVASNSSDISSNVYECHKSLPISYSPDIYSTDRYPTKTLLPSFETSEQSTTAINQLQVVGDSEKSDRAESLSSAWNNPMMYAITVPSIALFSFIIYSSVKYHRRVVMKQRINDVSAWARRQKEGKNVQSVESIDSSIMGTSQTITIGSVTSII